MLCLKNLASTMVSIFMLVSAYRAQFDVVLACLFGSSCHKMPNQPSCPLCGAGLSRLSDKATRDWWEERGLKWDWFLGQRASGEQAYWKLCEVCHREAWPHDRRVKGRYCLPGSAWKTDGGSKTKLLVGDLWITESPPAIAGPWTAWREPVPRAASSQVELALRVTEPARSRSPRVQTTGEDSRESFSERWFSAASEPVRVDTVPRKERSVCSFGAERCDNAECSAPLPTAGPQVRHPALAISFFL